MSNAKRLGSVLLGVMLYGGAWAQQSGSSTVTITSKDGITSVFKNIDPAIAGDIARFASEYGLNQLNFGSFNVASRGGGFGSGAAAAGGGSRWNLWAAAAYNRTGSSFQPLQTSGNVGVLSAGLDYRVSDNLLVGAALAGERTRTNLNYLAGGNLSGDGLTLAPYMAYVFNRSWALDASVGYGRGSYDVSGGGDAGSFRSTRTFGSIGLNYRHEIAASRWIVTGRGAVLSVSSKSGSFTSRNGNFADGTTSDLTQLRVGGQVAYAAGQVSPYFGLTYVYDIRLPGTVQFGTQTSSGDRDSWVPAIGLRFSGAGSVYGGLQLSSERGRSEVKNDQLRLNLGVRF